MASTTQQPTPAPVNPPVGVNPVAGSVPVSQPLPPGTVGRPQVNASLYIGDLDPEVGESALYDLFKDSGNVASIRVCRDAISRVSLGYAYVNFHTVESAEKAINVLNGALLNNRPCRIMWSRRDPSIRKSTVGNIFIKNLSPDVDHAALYDIFSTFGNIHSCKLVTNKQGQSKGYGFVHYHSKESAENAIKKMNNLKLNGKQVYVAPFVSARDRQRINPEDVYTNVYLKNLDENITEEEFRNIFSQFGEITSCKLAMDEENKKSKGFGFVNYMTHEQAVKCVETMNDTEVRGKTIYAARAQPRAERMELLRKKREERANKYQGVNLYIKNLDDSVDEEKLRKPFSEFGQITSVKIMTNEGLRSKGFGFVCFSKPDEATKALTKMNNFMLEGKPLYVALAQRKDQRRAQLEAQYAQRSSLARLTQPGAGIGLTPPIYPNPMFYPSVPNAPQTRGFIGYPQMPQQFRGGRPYNATQQAAYGQPGMPYPVNAARRGNTNAGGRVRGATNPPRGAQSNISNGPRKPQTGPKNPPSPSAIRPNEDEAQQLPESNKEILGNQLYETLMKEHPASLTGTLVGALLALYDETDLQNFLDNPDVLKERVAQILQQLSNRE